MVQRMPLIRHSEFTFNYPWNINIIFKSQSLFIKLDTVLSLSKSFLKLTVLFMCINTIEYYIWRKNTPWIAL